MQSIFPRARLDSTLVFVVIASLLSACSSEEDIGGASAAIPASGLTWVAPAARENNSPISMAEIAGYRIYYGETQGDYQNQHEVNDAYDNDLDPTELGLPAGGYYVVVTAVDTDGRESIFSEEVVLNI